MTIRRLVKEAAFWRDALKPEGRSEWTRNLLKRETRLLCVPAFMRRIIAMYQPIRPVVLDVGCGPISCLQALEDLKLIHLVAADPLAAEFAALLLIHEIDIQPPQFCYGESLHDKFQKDFFDIVFMRNALDHTKSPVQCVKAAASVLKPGGCFALLSKTDEGANASWGGAHDWNLRLESDDLICENKEGKSVSLFRDLPFAYLPQFQSRNGVWFSVVWRKKKD